MTWKEEIKIKGWRDVKDWVCSIIYIIFITCICYAALEQKRYVHKQNRQGYYLLGTGSDWFSSVDKPLSMQAYKKYRELCRHPDNE